MLLSRATRLEDLLLMRAAPASFLLRGPPASLWLQLDKVAARTDKPPSYPAFARVSHEKADICYVYNYTWCLYAVAFAIPAGQLGATDGITTIEKTACGHIELLIILIIVSIDGEGIQWGDY